MIKSSASKHKFFEIFNLMDDVMKAVNRSFGLQMLIMTLELFIYGLILIFCSAMSKSFFDTIQYFGISFFEHAILFQVSYITSSTASEVNCYHFFTLKSYNYFFQIRKIHKLAKKFYNLMPSEENLKFLDLNLSVTTYNCGLFKFDWELIKMVIIKLIEMIT